MKIIFFEVPKKEEAIFKGVFMGAEVLFFEEKLNENTTGLAKGADAVCVFINSVVDKNVLEKIPSLKFIATRSTGFDHIDCEYAKTKNIKVSNVSAYGSHTVAEFAFGLILNLSRNIINANNYEKELADFNYTSKMEGFDLNGKTLGVIGTGKIGKNVVKIAQGFGMKIVAYDLFPDLNFATENNFEYKNLKDLARESDVITLHAPCNKEDIHLINKELIAVMKKGVYLVNTARGELIDTEALFEGLRSDVIAGFGADVLECEKKMKENKSFFSSQKITKEEKRIVELNRALIKMPNTIITPHIAFYTREAVSAIQNTTIENIKGFISGSPINLVN